MSTLDLKSGYFQFAISPKDIEKTAFITRNGTFAFLRMPFGLSGVAPNFQKAIDIILKPVIGCFVSVYMDDVIITSPSFNEHLDHLNQVFTLLRDAGLTLNKDKCHFARDKLKYLGLDISKVGIETDHSKVKAITEMKPPKNSKEVSKFLGMVGWYQKFIPQYVDIYEPLYRLKKKGAKFNWSTEAHDSFDKIKRSLTEAPVLQLMNFTEQFNLFTDASGVRIGAVLNQSHRPIAVASRTLNKVERNYTVTEREYVRNPVGNLDGSQISCAALRALALNSREQLIREQREDPELGHIYSYLENPDNGSANATICEGWSQDFKLIDGLLFYTKYYTTLGELRVYIPKLLCETIRKEFHDLPLAGHLGKRKTYLKLRDTCYFPYIRKYIFQYVSTCDWCQKFNYKNALPAGRLIPIVLNYPNEIVTLDLLGPSKWSELIPLRKALAQAIANTFFENSISRYGAPISLISDNCPQFISEVFEHLSHRLDIKHMKMVTYRPQANLTES
ncbi:retrovirus-related Pol polyprotein from transposon 17.6 [Trichonephila clavipes]|nr:retrovirus-related Pol polyprotein from transposon 17.6 [Trichonephila clavipes]